MNPVFIYTTGLVSGKKNIIGLTEDQLSAVCHRDYLKAVSLGLSHEFYMYLVSFIPICIRL